jgi:hypothetical protein
MKTTNAIYSAIQFELKDAEHAMQIGNIGKVRVCVRRACGIAIANWLSFHTNKNWGESAINQLKELMDDKSFPVEIREATKRLTAKVNQHFNTGFEENPIEDGNMIVKYFLSQINL